MGDFDFGEFFGDVAGDLARGLFPDVFGGAASGVGNPPAPPFGSAGTSPGQFPQLTGTLRMPQKRRRRRRLITPTDLSDLAALKAIVGGGDALKFAVTKAVRR